MSHAVRYFACVAMSTTFSTITSRYRWCSMNRSTSNISSRERFLASSDSGSSNSPSSIAGSFVPFPCHHFVHSGDAQRMSVLGKYEGRSCCRSTTA